MKRKIRKIFVDQIESPFFSSLKKVKQSSTAKAEKRERCLIALLFRLQSVLLENNRERRNTCGKLPVRKPLLSPHPTA
jgi:hypothetical protein